MTGFPLAFVPAICQHIDMDCIYCGEKTKTVNSRRSGKGLQTWRRRRCSVCHAVFTTNELPDISLAVRVKTKTGLQPFSREKLYSDVSDSLSHRKTAQIDAEALLRTIILKLLPCKSGVLEVSEIKTAATEVLERFDKAAATYYRAHHY